MDQAKPPVSDAVGEQNAVATTQRERLHAYLGCVLLCAAAAAFFALSAPLQAQTQQQLTQQSAPRPDTTPPPTNPNAPEDVPNAAKAAAPGPQSQTSDTGDASSAVSNPLPALSTSIWSEAGEPVTAIRFDGVKFSSTDPLLGQLKQRIGKPLDPNDVRADMRTLFASGRYRNLAIYGQKGPAGITLVFVGTPRFYVGRVSVNGIRQEQLASLESFATKLDPGTAFTEAQIPTAVESVRDSLAENGYFEPTLSVTTTRDNVGHQENVAFDVDTGPQARVGPFTIAGADAGITLDEFRKKGGLRCSLFVRTFKPSCDPKVTRDTVSNALSGVRNYYQKKDRLEGTISLQKQTYVPARKQLDYSFEADQGPIVKVVIDGAKVSNSRKKLLVPIYEEGTVDIDLMNEGAFNIRDYLQQEGYFEATDSVKLLGKGTGQETVQYTVDEGPRYRVMQVSVTGDKYFSPETLEEGLRVKKGDLFERSGTYSTQLVDEDKDSIAAIYRASGFSHVKVTADTRTVEKDKQGRPLKMREIFVDYKVEEGAQQKFGVVTLDGVAPSRVQTIRGLMSTQQGQPFSLQTLSDDRDAIVGWYLAHGFDHANVTFAENVAKDDANRTNITITVTEGHQVFVDHVLLSGIVHTRRSLVERQLLVHAGDPLNQSALLQTQRNLYNLALFNEVNAAVQNPTGRAEEKNVLVQLTEAKRWDVTYGFGMEAQTGTPALGLYQTQRGSTAAQNGHAGVSPRVSLDISRINLGGTQKSLTLQTEYGLLEEIFTLSFNNPQFLGRKSLTGTISGGYSNVQNITTFQAATLQGDARLTQKYKLADTFIYDFQYRRVTVNPNSLEITPNLIPQFSEPVTVGGPEITWFHDTRDPSPLDATRGNYFSIQEFFSDHAFGAQTDFSSTDTTYSSYYTFGKKKYVFARNTRIAFQNFYGGASGVSSLSEIGLQPNCSGILLTTNATCNPIPLPERLYAGGEDSIRGFGINDAGPRDLTTGYPVGGSGAVVNSFELRLPPPTLPFVGNSLSFVLFHDMGNVFRYPKNMFSSIAHFHQPNESTCRNVSVTPGVPVEDMTGTCNFNYYSHDVGVGLRYKTPVGPIRLDFSYNLDPPIYPVFDDYTGAAPHVGSAGHFNFFFSIGQAF